jgi:EpsI family protein
MSRVQAALVGALLLAVGAAAWAMALRPPLQVDASPLAGLPLRFDEWTGIDVPVEGAVEEMLRADFNLQRRYREAAGHDLWVYVGYYGTARGGRPEHTPRACYEAHGWQIRERRVLSAPGETGLHVNEYVVERDGMRQLVHFWFRSARATGLLSEWDRALDQIQGRLRGERADGSLVRVSTPLAQRDLEVERSRMLRFAERLDEQLGAHWPRELPRGEG